MNFFYRISIYLTSFCSFTVSSSSQNLNNQEFNKTNVTIFSVEEIDRIKDYTQIETLSIIIPKKPKKTIVIFLKNPEALKVLNINNPEWYRFVNFFPNLNGIGIEGNFKGNLDLKFNPLSIKVLSIYNFTSENYSFLSQFHNLDTLQVGFNKTPSALFESINNLVQLKYLNFRYNQGELKLNENFLFKIPLEYISGNMSFTYENLIILNKIKTLNHINFSKIKIKKKPINFEEIKKNKTITFEMCF